MGRGNPDSPKRPEETEKPRYVQEHAGEDPVDDAVVPDTICEGTTLPQQPVQRDDSKPPDPANEPANDPANETASIDTWLPSRTPEYDSHRRPASAFDLRRTDRVNDFLIVRRLGRGAFGAVYLARQISLDRLVALKIAPSQREGPAMEEGRSLARLTHPNIVSVYGETVDPASEWNLLWMQFIDGATLEKVIHVLYQESGPGEAWTGDDFLNAICKSAGADDSGRTHPRDSVEWEHAGQTKVVCRIGEQLAEALRHSHNRGVLHRDVKPANVLIRRDGTPYLTDFNLADDASHAEQFVGGTPAYMAPEQLDAMASSSGGRFATTRSDLYSLAVVLWEVASGQRPFAKAESRCRGSGAKKRLEQYASIRRSCVLHPQPADHRLAEILSRCLNPDPAGRCSSPSGLATALRGLASLYTARGRMPRGGHPTRWIVRFPYTAMILVGLIPQFAASCLHTLYNLSWIPSHEHDSFFRLLVWYNALIYPLCVSWLMWRMLEIHNVWKRIGVDRDLKRAIVRKGRRRLLKFPADVTLVAAVGWFPGAVIYPLLMAMMEQRPIGGEWVHYLISFTVCGMIASTYSYFGVLSISLIGLYDRFWTSTSDFPKRVRLELAGVQKRIRRVAVLAGVLPLAAAAVLLWDAPQDATSAGLAALHTLVISLIVAGAAGFYLIDFLSDRLLAIVDALTNRR